MLERSVLEEPGVRKVLEAHVELEAEEPAVERPEVGVPEVEVPEVEETEVEEPESEKRSNEFLVEARTVRYSES